MTQNYYILLDANHPSVLDICTTCYRKTRSNSLNIMPEKISFSAQEHFVKIIDADSDWFTQQNFPVGAIIWHFPQGNEIGNQVQERWKQAQCPRFFPGGIADPAPGTQLATIEERYAYWHDLWQDLINE